MSVWIERNNDELGIHRVSAQKSLAMPDSVQAGDLGTIREAFTYGRPYDDKEYLRKSRKWDGSGRWGKNPAVHELNDFEHLLKLLVTDESDKSIEFRRRVMGGESGFANATIFDQVRKIWSEVIPGKEINLISGKVLVTVGDGEQFNGSNMSDGEREAFYFIAEALCVAPDSLVIIDEPENHMHEAILPRLWDAIERARPDCVFMYVTHKLSFATSRHGATMVWVKGMPSRGVWDYCVLPQSKGHDGSSIPEELLLEIMGSRQDVMLVEGDGSRSWDRALYQQLIPGKNVINVGGCNQVIESVKALRRLDVLAGHVNVCGIVDRDCRSDEEIRALLSQEITVLDVAEVENAFLLPCAIRAVVGRLGMQAEEGAIVGEAQRSVLAHLAGTIDEQIMMRVRHHVRSDFNRLSGSKADGIDEYLAIVKTGANEIDVNDLVDCLRAEYEAIVQSTDYEAALRVVNHKGLYQISGLKARLGLDAQAYMKLVVRILADKSSSERIREANALAAQMREGIGLAE